MRWIPLQNIMSKRWRLSVIHDDCLSYDVTDVEADNIDKIISCANFMNNEKCGSLDSYTFQKLLNLKKEYGLVQETDEQKYVSAGKALI